MNPPEEHDVRELERLRAQLGNLSAHAPGVLVDNAIRAAARQRVVRRRLRSWSIAASLAACVGLAVVLVPALLINTSAPVAPHAPAEIAARAEFAAAPQTAAEHDAAQERGLAMKAPPRPLGSPPQPALAALRAELADADEHAWRDRILALADKGERRIAESLLEDFRERFERPEDFSLEDLRAETADE